MTYELEDSVKLQSRGPVAVPRANFSWTLSRCGVGSFNPYSDIDKCQRGATQGLIFAEYQSKITANLRIGEGNCRQDFRLDIFLNIGASYEPHADVGGHKPFKQLAGIQFHGISRLEFAFVEKIIESVARMPGLR